MRPPASWTAVVMMSAEKAKAFALKALEIGSLADYVLPIVEELAGVAKPVEILEEPGE